MISAAERFRELITAIAFWSAYFEI